MQDSLFKIKKGKCFLSLLKISSLCFLFTHSPITLSLSELNEPRFSEMRAKIEVIANKNIPRSFNGVILIAKDKDIIYEKSLGQYGSPKRSDQFIIGSVSKQITATLILRLIDQGLIQLNAPIKQYLPELKDEWTSSVTVKHLLNHTSGIKAIGEPLEFQPGTQFKYSPIMSFYLASKIAENVTRKPFDKLLSEMFTVADMKNSGIVISENLKENQEKYSNLVQGYYEDGEKNIKPLTLIAENGDGYNPNWNPGGGIISTVDDLLKWNLALHQGKLLSPKVYKLMITPSSLRDHPIFGKVGYGFGIQILKTNTFLEISHNGYLDGYASTLIYYPRQRISLIILENVSLSSQNFKRAFSIHDEIRKILHEELIKE